LGYASTRSLFAPGELPKILLSASVLGLAFTIVLKGNLMTFLFALATVGVGFVGHELAHKFMAMRFGYYASYQIWPMGLLLALVFSLFNFIFAALGAVQIYGRGLNKAEQGIISLAGPTFNVVLAVFFLVISIPTPKPYSGLLLMGAQLNSLIALFNCIPFSILDGRKILYWDRFMWILVVMASGAILLVAWGY
jgi:Zn-dependent protease